MSPPDPEKLRDWLASRFGESRCMEFLSQDNIQILCEKSAQYFYKDGQLESGDLAKWMITEFDVPEKEVYELLQQLKQEGADLEIQVLLPGESAPAAPSPSGKSGGAVHKGAPPSKNMYADLAGFLHDRPYLEWTILEHAKGGFQSEVPELNICLHADFQLTEEECSLLQEEELKPGGAEETAAGWVLRVNGLALACSAARAASVSNDPKALQEWLKAVYKLQGNFGQLISRILGKRKEVNQEGAENESAALEAAWHRFNKQYEGLKADYSKAMTSSSAGPTAEEKRAAREQAQTQAAKKQSAPKPASAGISGPSSKSKIKLPLAIAAALLILVVAGVYVLSEMGLVGSHGEKINTDLSFLSVKVTDVLQADNEMIVKVDKSSWDSLSKSDKESELRKMHEAALNQGLKLVKVVSGNGQVLSQVIGKGNYLIFQ